MAVGKIVLSGAALLVVAGLIVFSVVPSCRASDPGLSIVRDVPTQVDPNAETVEVVIDGRVFHCELALSFDQRYRGLSDRESIAADGGMVFAFRDEQKRSFVMRRCYVPIDILYLDKDGRVVSTHQMEVIEPVGGMRWNNPLGGYPSGKPAQFAVEIKGGLLDELDVKVGDIVEFPREELKRRAQ